MTAPVPLPIPLTQDIIHFSETSCVQFQNRSGFPERSYLKMDFLQVTPYIMQFFQMYELSSFYSSQYPPHSVKKASTRSGSFWFICTVHYLQALAYINEPPIFYCRGNNWRVFSNIAFASNE